MAAEKSAGGTPPALVSCPFSRAAGHCLDAAGEPDAAGGPCEGRRSGQAQGKGDNIFLHDGFPVCSVVFDCGSEPPVLASQSQQTRRQSGPGRRGSADGKAPSLKGCWLCRRYGRCRVRARKHRRAGLTPLQGAARSMSGHAVRAAGCGPACKGSVRHAGRRLGQNAKRQEPKQRERNEEDKGCSAAALHSALLALRSARQHSRSRQAARRRRAQFICLSRPACRRLVVDGAASRFRAPESRLFGRAPGASPHSPVPGPPVGLTGQALRLVSGHDTRRPPDTLSHSL